MVFKIIILISLKIQIPGLTFRNSASVVLAGEGDWNCVAPLADEGEGARGPPLNHWHCYGSLLLMYRQHWICTAVTNFASKWFLLFNNYLVSFPLVLSRASPVITAHLSLALLFVASWQQLLSHRVGSGLQASLVSVQQHLPPSLLHGRLSVSFCSHRKKGLEKAGLGFFPS